MPSRRPFDQIKTLLAAVLGVPALAGAVYLLLFLVGVVWRDSGVVAASAVLVVGVAALVVVTYRSYELIRSAGGR